MCFESVLTTPRDKRFATKVNGLFPHILPYWGGVLSAEANLFRELNHSCRPNAVRVCFKVSAQPPSRRRRPDAGPSN